MALCAIADPERRVWRTTCVHSGAPIRAVPPLRGILYRMWLAAANDATLLCPRNAPGPFFLEVYMILDHQMSSALCGALRDGQTLAQRNQQPEVQIEHVLLSVLAQESNVVALLRALNVDINYLIRRLDRDCSAFPKSNATAAPAAASRLEQALQLAFEQASNAGRTYAQTTDFLAGICNVPNGSAPVMLRSMNLSAYTVSTAASGLSLSAEAQNTAVSPFSYVPPQYQNFNAPYSAPAQNINTFATSNGAAPQSAAQPQ